MSPAYSPSSCTTVLVCPLPPQNVAGPARSRPGARHPQLAEQQPGVHQPGHGQFRGPPARATGQRRVEQLDERPCLPPERGVAGGRHGEGQRLDPGPGLGREQDLDLRFAVLTADPPAAVRGGVELRRPGRCGRPGHRSPGRPGPGCLGRYAGVLDPRPGCAEALPHPVDLRPAPGQWLVQRHVVREEPHRHLIIPAAQQLGDGLLRRHGLWPGPAGRRCRATDRHPCLAPGRASVLLVALSSAWAARSTPSISLVASTDAPA